MQERQGIGVIRWPKLQGSPVLDSIRPVIEHSQDVHTNLDRVIEVAGWMGYEELPMPDYILPLGIGDRNVDDIIDFILTACCIDTAFTDFSSQVKFQVEYAGRIWSDSDALFACMKRAMDNGVHILGGSFLASVTPATMRQIFTGNIELPMLEEKTEIWRQVGGILAEKFDGRFHKFVRTCSRRLYDHGKGLVDGLVREFPRFRDISLYLGHTINFFKLPQLAAWYLYTSLRKSGRFDLEDLNAMTAFADYIVPVGLRLLGITSYSPQLEHAINSHQTIPKDSPWEVEIRAHCIYATALLTEEVNKVRPAERQVITPQIDARLWTHYHTAWWPHHLTRTIMY